jgi:hypothetical protein
MAVNNKLKEWNKAPVVYFEVRMQRLYGETFEIHENNMIFPGIEIRSRDVLCSVVNSSRDRLD